MYYFIDYWSGKEMHKGGPDCTKVSWIFCLLLLFLGANAIQKSDGWTIPKASESKSLAEYSGRVRLVPK